jgi:hypothetical protein
MMTTTDGAGKGRADRFSREYEMVVTRRRRLLGFGGLDELVLIGLWTDAAGRRKRTELVRLGAASSVDTALRLAAAGMELHPAGTRQHRRYADWHRRLKATEWAMVHAEARYRRMVAELAGDVPVYAPGLTMAE